MLQEIGSNIVTFLLGAALTFFLEKGTGVFQRLGAVEFGVQALLRDRMLQMFSYYKEKGKKVPMRERESFECMYQAYTDNDGNSFMPDVREEFLELPHETH